MAASTIVKHLYDGSLTVEDGTTPTPVSFDLDFSIGDFSLSGLSADQAEVQAYKIRGKVASLRKTSSTEPTGSFSCYLADVSDVTDQTLIDFVLKQGSFTANESTTKGLGDITTYNLTWEIEGTDLGDVSDHTIKCEDCHITLDLSEGEPNTISFSFTVYGDVTMT